MDHLFSVDQRSMMYTRNCKQSHRSSMFLRKTIVLSGLSIALTIPPIQSSVSAQPSKRTIFPVQKQGAVNRKLLDLRISRQQTKPGSSESSLKWPSQLKSKENSESKGRSILSKVIGNNQNRREKSISALDWPTGVLNGERRSKRGISIIKIGL